MFQFFETIKVKNCKVFNLDLHQQRVNHTFKQFYNTFNPLNLEKIISDIKLPASLSRIRISYNQKDYKIELIPYQRRTIEKLYLIYDDNIDYRFKYTDRSRFTKCQKLLHETFKTDIEPVFVVKGYITDTTFSNLAFYDGKSWFTPKTYLLLGTKRVELINKKILNEIDLTPEDIKYFQQVSLINSMNDLDEIILSITDILNL